MPRRNIVTAFLLVTLLVPCYWGLWDMASDWRTIAQARAEVSPDPHRPEGQDFRPIVQYPPKGTELLGLLVLTAYLHAVMVVVLGERRGTPLWRSLAVHFAVLAAALALLEMGTRAYIARVSPPYRPDALLMYRARPKEGNPYGLRLYTAPERTGAKRVLVLGDSATFGAYVREGEEWPSLVPMALGDEGLVVEVVNAAIPGYSSFQGRFLGPELIAYYKPDVVVFGYNNDGYPAEREDVTRVPASETERGILQALYRSEAYLLLRRVLVNAAIRVKGEMPERKENTYRVSTRQHVDNMKAIAEAAKAAGARVVMLTMPTSHYPGMDEATARAAQESGAMYLDLNPIWEGNSVLRKQLMPDIVHPTPEGHRRIAALIAPRLAELLQQGRPAAAAPSSGGPTP